MVTSADTSGRRKILLVEDSPQDAKLMLQAFKSNGIDNDVVVVRDGQEALDFLRREEAFATRPPGHPAVVLLDLKLPKLNGLDVLKLVKSDPALRRIPVVMITSSREESDLVRSYDLGVNAFVVKPIDFTQFAEAMKELGVFWAAINEPPPEPQ